MFQHIYTYYVEPIVTFINSTENLFVQISILPKHVSHVPMSLYNINDVPILIDVGAYLANRKQYIQVRN